MTEYPTTWFWRSAPLNEDWSAVQSFITEEFARPSTIEADAKPTLADPYSTISLENDRLVIWSDRSYSPKVPDLWYLLVSRHQEPFPATYSIVAFADNRFPDGHVLEVEEFRRLGHTTADQVAAVRWEQESGKLQQVYVSSDYRRMGISFRLFNVADILHIASGASTFLNGGEEVTADGEKLAKAWEGSPRIKEKKASFSPMD